jgi:soluble lytic murein transglycosylase-like protein
MKRKRMSPGRFLTLLNLAWFGMVALLLFAAERGHNQAMAWKESHRQLAVKNRLLRKAIANQQWEIDRAREIKKETDALRWCWRQTELQHRDWTAITETVWKLANKHGVRPDLIMAVIHRESYFDAQALSQAGAYGLMQVRLEVWGPELGLTAENIRDIQTNIEAGIKVLKIYLEANAGDEAAALLEYWAGKKPPNDSYVGRIRSSKFYRGT